MFDFEALKTEKFENSTESRLRAFENASVGCDDLSPQIVSKKELLFKRRIQSKRKRIFCKKICSPLEFVWMNKKNQPNSLLDSTFGDAICLNLCCPMNSVK